MPDIINPKIVGKTLNFKYLSIQEVRFYLWWGMPQIKL